MKTTNPYLAPALRSLLSDTRRTFTPIEAIFLHEAAEALEAASAKPTPAAPEKPACEHGQPVSGSWGDITRPDWLDEPFTQPFATPVLMVEAAEHLRSYAISQERCAHFWREKFKQEASDHAATQGRFDSGFDKPSPRNAFLSKEDIVLALPTVDAGPLAQIHIEELHRLLAPVLDAAGFAPGQEKAENAINRLLMQWRSGLEPRVPPAPSSPAAERAEAERLTKWALPWGSVEALLRSQGCDMERAASWIAARLRSAPPAVAVTDVEKAAEKINDRIHEEVADWFKEIGFKGGGEMGYWLGTVPITDILRDCTRAASVEEVAKAFHRGECDSEHSASEATGVPWENANQPLYRDGARAALRALGVREAEKNAAPPPAPAQAGWTLPVCAGNADTSAHEWNTCVREAPRKLGSECVRCGVKDWWLEAPKVRVRLPYLRVEPNDTDITRAHNAALDDAANVLRSAGVEIEGEPDAS